MRTWTTLLAFLAMAAAAAYPSGYNISYDHIDHAAIRLNTIHADGCDIFYREAGSHHNSTIILLHGYPASSYQYRNLMPILAQHHRVIAPDFPSFGFTVTPANYSFTFASFASTTAAFIDALGLHSYALYVFDYGAPVGFRLLLQRPQQVTAIVTQNGNGYIQGLGAPWDPIKTYWADPSPANRAAIADFVTLDAFKSQYQTGAEHPEQIPPETWSLDYYLTILQHADSADRQLDILYDYRTNVELYPAFNEAFRRLQKPTLAVWGAGDTFFVPAGAEAFKQDNTRAEVVLVDAGHFALETNLRQIAGIVTDFLRRHRI